MHEQPTSPSTSDSSATEIVDGVVVRPIDAPPSTSPAVDAEYAQRHALKRPLRVIDIWALGVGVVITGEYFGWNLALKGNGPIAVLIASLIVSLLYLVWVLALSELSVAMPYAGGPLAYGRRAVDSSLGFVMGWSMFLECQFATIATALATGGYIAFLLDPQDPSPTIQVASALATVAIFLLLHIWGVKEQSRAMVLMTYGAILGLVIFWCLAAPSFSWDRIWTRPLLPSGKGWQAVLDAVPYCLWWLVIIETVALAAEEAQEPERTIPRGLVWAQLTLIVLVVLTWLFACGSVDDAQQLAVDAEGRDISYPLAKVISLVPAGRSPWAVYSFGTIALFGMIASYHGMVYGTSRQAFALGRAGYLPAILGEVHATRRTPVIALILSSAVTAAFVIANLWFKDAIAVAVLVSTMTALVWYILAIGCLFILRKREPGLLRHYRAPLGRTLPVTVLALSAFSLYVYSGIDVKVIPLTALLYALGLAYYWFFARAKIQSLAPEERSAHETQSHVAHADANRPTKPIDFATAALLLLVLAAVAWMVFVPHLPDSFRLSYVETEVRIVIALLTAAVGLVSLVSLLHTRQ
jgi:ethanolamine permease